MRRKTFVEYEAEKIPAEDRPLIREDFGKWVNGGDLEAMERLFDVYNEHLCGGVRMSPRCSRCRATVKDDYALILKYTWI